MTSTENVRIDEALPLVGVLSVPDGATDCIVLSHGFTSSKNGRTCVQLEDRLNDEGFATLRYDFFGHGESGGAFPEVTISKAVKNLEQAIHYVRAQGFANVGLFGSSFGGMVTTLVASKDKELFAVVLKSPVTDYEGKEREKYGEEGIARWKSEGAIDREKSDEPGPRLNYSFFEDTLLHNGYTAARSVQAPVRILHGDGDDVVPIAQSMRAADLFPLGELVALAGVTHDYDKPGQFERMIALTVQWFVRHRPEESQ